MNGPSGSSANIQGQIHVPTPLGSRRKKRKLRKAARTLYVNRPVLNADAIIAWAKSIGIAKCVAPGDMHVTLAFSRTAVEWPEEQVGEIKLFPTNPMIARFGLAKDCIVLTFEDEELEARWKQFVDWGCSWDWPDYRPHITLTYTGFNEPDLHEPIIEPYRGVLVLGPEEFAEVNEDWKAGAVAAQKRHVDIFKDYSPEVHAMTDKLAKIGARNSKKDLDMIQSIHDTCCKLGADCHGLAGYDAEVGKSVRIAKLDDALGLVFGYAIVCKVNGEDYYDLNIDKADDGSYKRVPEHIPESAMLKVAADFMASANRPGNEMHKGDDSGTYVFAFPLTTDIAKAFGIQTNTTGLMVAYKPTPEVFAKYKSGEYTGFSIEGRRVSAKMLEE